MCDGGTADTELLIGAGVRPDVCPAGHFYTTDVADQSVRKCDGDAIYALTPPPDGAKMSDGNPYPAGALLLKRAV